MLYRIWWRWLSFIMSLFLWIKLTIPPDLVDAVVMQKSCRVIRKTRFRAREMYWTTADKIFGDQTALFDFVMFVFGTGVHNNDNIFNAEWRENFRFGLQGGGSAGAHKVRKHPPMLPFNSLPAKLSHLNFHPLEVVSRYRDPQLQVGENYSYLIDLRPILMFKHSFRF